MKITRAQLSKLIREEAEKAARPDVQFSELVQYSHDAGMHGAVSKLYSMLRSSFSDADSEKYLHELIEDAFDDALESEIDDDEWERRR